MHRLQAAPSSARADFPPNPEPGACYVRRLDGPAAPAGPPAPGIWTLRRGHGPQAVWRYSEEGTTADGRAFGSTEPYGWVRVLCDGGQAPLGRPVHAHAAPHTGTTGEGLPPPPVAYAEAPPPPPMAVPPPPPAPTAPPPHLVPPPPPLLEAPPHAHPAPHAELFAPHGFRHMPPPHRFEPAPPPPLPGPRPRWFGDRFLTWPGKLFPF